MLLVEPGELDATVQRPSPKLVICSALSRAVNGPCCTWILLYPEGQSLACFRLDGRQDSGPELDLARSIALIDATERLLAQPAGGLPHKCAPHPARSASAHRRNVCPLLPSNELEKDAAFSE